jgi:hypothetical protein
MLSRDSHLRTYISLLLAVVVPFCCCNFHSLLTACEACVPACAGHHGQTAPANGHEQHDHQHGGGSDGRSDSGTRHHHDGPSDGDPQDCTCGKHEAKMLSGEKPTIELPTAVLVAILSWVAVPPSAAEPSRLFSNGEIWASARPATSLLRLHCALIV